MVWTEPQSHQLKRMRWAYELGRLKRALLGFSPMAVLIAGIFVMSGHSRWVVPLGLVLFASGVALLWYGREPARWLMPGLLAGLVPLGCSLAAFTSHAGCGCGQCVSFCRVACGVGGMLAGLMVGLLASHGEDKKRLGYWVEASGMAVLTGSLGCSCMGFSGITTLIGGYGMGILVSGVRLLLEPEKTA